MTLFYDNRKTFASQASFIERFLAKSIDIAFIVLLMIFLGRFGTLVAIFFLAASETEQFALGKRLFSLKTIKIDNEQSSLNLKEGAERNLFYIIFMILGLFTFWGFILSCFLLLTFALLEIFFLMSVQSRLSDLISHTTVLKK